MYLIRLLRLLSLLPLQWTILIFGFLKMMLDKDKNSGVRGKIQKPMKSL